MDQSKAAAWSNSGINIYGDIELSGLTDLFKSTFGFSSPSTDSSEEARKNELGLLSGSCYFLHPNKEAIGGEDAHFICSDEQVVGVADGVGGRRDVGIDSGKYANELMTNSITAVQEEPKDRIDPLRVLKKAHRRTKLEGSSTACIIALRDQGLCAINLGDSGFIVVRNRCVILRSPVQQHEFNFPYQLMNGPEGDPPSSGQVIHNVKVAPGDVVIAGTDGLFDNLFEHQITGEVFDAMSNGLAPHDVAQKIASFARDRSCSRVGETPYSIAARAAGRFRIGGKMDDITVIASYVIKSSTL